MNKECRICGALKWNGMCCSGGKVALPSIDEPVKPLKELFSYETDESRRFLKNIRKYNTCFHMTSFGADNIVSLQVFRRSEYVQGVERNTVRKIQVLHDHNILVHEFKMAKNRVTSDNYKVVMLSQEHMLKNS
ncbi:helitron_like_N domain-containing protein [Trichonephila clavipes]|nr:helitron_like_N domain-containing protein [Trichonephila clavipes]